jgi:hypothetical protein
MLAHQAAHRRQRRGTSEALPRQLSGLRSSCQLYPTALPICRHLACLLLLGDTDCVSLRCVRSAANLLSSTFPRACLRPPSLLFSLFLQLRCLVARRCPAAVAWRATTALSWLPGASRSRTARRTHAVCRPSATTSTRRSVSTLHTVQCMEQHEHSAGDLILPGGLHAIVGARVCPPGMTL